MLKPQSVPRCRTHPGRRGLEVCDSHLPPFSPGQKRLQETAAPNYSPNSWRPD
jgi:hypothetical protein